MPLNHFTVLMSPTYRCNADCEYCFENKTSHVMELEEFELILPRIVTYLQRQEITELRFIWTGGEILTMPSEWLLRANDLCRETAPDNFKRNDDGGDSFVYKQPENPEEEARCKEAKEGCPVEAIGDNGA